MGKKYLFVVVCCLLLLVGCTSQEYKDTLKSGKDEMEQKNYSMAIEAFQKAIEITRAS